MRILVAFGASVPLGWAGGSILLAPPNPWPPLVAASIIVLVGLLSSEVRSLARRMGAVFRGRHEQPQLDRTP